MQNIIFRAFNSNLRVLQALDYHITWFSIQGFPFQEYDKVGLELD